MQYPRLRDDPQHRITSEDDDRYNCVAWVEQDTKRWWEPDYYWPVASKPAGDEDLDCYVELFRSLGFEECGSALSEEGYSKIALYAEDGEFHHVAKQLRSGRWSSKGGTLQDFTHGALAALEDCPVTPGATATVFMRRPDRGELQFEETGLILPGDRSRDIPPSPSSN